MAVKISVGDDDRAILLNASDYSVGEDATPVDPSDETGGTSQIDFSMPAWPHWKAARGKALSLSDTAQGRTQGRVTSLAESQDLVSVTASSRLQNLSATRTAKPFVGTLEGAIRYYLSLVGIVDGIVVNASNKDAPVVFQGWVGDVYQQVARKLCPAWSMEMSLVSDNIVFRDFRGRKAMLQRLTGPIKRSIDDGDAAQSVKATWYKTRQITNELVYPPGGWTSDVEVYSVNARETKVVESLDLSATVTDIVQPTCVTDVGPLDASASVYTVTGGSDGLPIPPAMWAAYGGSVRLDINDDMQSLKLTITGMDFDQYAPYSIAVASGPSNMYSTLRVLGTGVAFEPQTMEQSTGLTQDEAPNEVSGEVDNIFLNDSTQARQVTSWQIGSAHGPKNQISFEAAGINRATDNGSAAYATFADFDAMYAGKTFADFDAIWAGKTVAEFDAYWAEQAAGDFRNQAFGNVAGARLVYDGSYYRIRSATNSQGAISGSADADNTIADFDTIYAGMTFAEFDELWAGKTVEEFDISPFPGLR